MDILKFPPEIRQMIIRVLAYNNSMWVEDCWSMAMTSKNFFHELHSIYPTTKVTLSLQTQEDWDDRERIREQSLGGEETHPETPFIYTIEVRVGGFEPEEKELDSFLRKIFEYRFRCLRQIYLTSKLGCIKTGPYLRQLKSSILDSVYDTLEGVVSLVHEIPMELTCYESAPSHFYLEEQGTSRITCQKSTSRATDLDSICKDTEILTIWGLRKTLCRLPSHEHFPELKGWRIVNVKLWRESRNIQDQNHHHLPCFPVKIECQGLRAIEIVECDNSDSLFRNVNCPNLEVLKVHVEVDREDAICNLCTSLEDFFPTLKKGLQCFILRIASWSDSNRKLDPTMLVKHHWRTLEHLHLEALGSVKNIFDGWCAAISRLTALLRLVISIDPLIVSAVQHVRRVRWISRYKITQADLDELSFSGQPIMIKILQIDHHKLSNGKVRQILADVTREKKLILAPKGKHSKEWFGPRPEDDSPYWTSRVLSLRRQDRWELQGYWDRHREPSGDGETLRYGFDNLDFGNFGKGQHM